MASAERAIEYATEKLGQLVIDEIKFLTEVRADVYWMQSELRWMSCFLEDADIKGKNGDKRTRTWIRELTKVANEAEDVVDTFILQIDTKNRKRNRFFQRYACFAAKLVDLHYIGNEILVIRSKIHTISERKERYGISNLGESSDSNERNLRTQRDISPHLANNKYYVGFGGHKKLILERLIDPQVKKYVVVPIVGMGGLGKTTLATMIYNSDAVKDWFPCHAWVTVSEEFNPLELFRSLIKQVGEDLENYTNMNTTELKVQVHDCLKKQRYFVVLDDIWEQKPDVWNQLKDVFPNVENGSRVLITTRFIDVAKSVDTTNEPNVLPFLDDTESWELFLNVVFPSGDGLEPKCPEGVEILGKDLVRKCGGLPLGVCMLGGLLSVKEPTIIEWNKVAAKWDCQDKRLEYLQILALSYNNLPNINMKSCFLYIGSYPEDYIIRASELTKFWIAEGFILKEENQTFEETANDYLDEFVMRCMVQVVDRTKTSKRVKHFRIHDLYRKWCVSEAQEDGFFRICTSNTDTPGPEVVDARRLIVYKSTLDDKFFDLSYKARAILGFDYLFASNFFLSNIAQNFKLLRVLYLNFPENVKIHWSKSLKKISRLIHLRNITLTSKALTYLPSSIGKLHNLQTLNVKNTSILKLPAALYQIHSLRHLYAKGIVIKTSVNWNLRNLQTLDSIKAGSWMLKDLSKLLNLRKLSIFGITRDGVRMLHDSLCMLNHLKSLCLESYNQPATSLFISFGSHNPLSKLVLINWSNVSSEFPQNLISIKLSGCTFEKGVIASLEKLPGLANLNLKDCGIHSEDEFVFSANGFHQLENLHIDEMRSSLVWKIENGALPKINFLMIRASGWLLELPDGLVGLRSLMKLELSFPKGNLLNRLLETQEDLHKVPQITYVSLNGIQLDQYKRSSNITSSDIMMSFDDDEPVLSTEDLSEGKHRSEVKGRTAVRFIFDFMEPLGGNNYMERLEAMGTNPGGNRPGVDIVTILDVSLKNLELLKSAMKLLIEKLSPIDRLSIVILSIKPTKLCSLRQITESSLDDFETLVNNSAFGPDRNITAGIQMALKVINSRRFTTGRLAAVMLISDATPNKDDYSTAKVQLGNIPVYVFALGKHHDPRVLNEISKGSRGVRFFPVGNTNQLRYAFTQCFILLFVLATSDLMSKIQTAYAGSCPQNMDIADGSATGKIMDSIINDAIAGKFKLPTHKYNASSFLNMNIGGRGSQHAAYWRLLGGGASACDYGGQSSQRPDDKVVDKPPDDKVADKPPNIS